MERVNIVVAKFNKDELNLLYNNVFKEISNKLNISVHTTKAHLESIYSKFSACNRVQVVVKAIQSNLIDIDNFNLK